MKLAHLLEEVATYAADANILPLPGEKWEKLKTQCRDGRPLMRIERADTTIHRIRVIYALEIACTLNLPWSPKLLTALRGWAYLAFKMLRVKFFYDMTGKPNKKNMDVLKD